MSFSRSRHHQLPRVRDFEKSINGGGGTGGSNGGVGISSGASLLASSSSAGESSSGSSPNSSSITMPTNSLGRGSSSVGFGSKQPSVSLAALPRSATRYQNLPGTLGSQASPTGASSVTAKDLKDNLIKLKKETREMQNINTTQSATQQQIAKRFHKAKSFNESHSDIGLNAVAGGIRIPNTGLERHPTSPAIMEVPSTAEAFSQSPTDVDSMLEGANGLHSSHPIVTSPVSEMTDFSDGGGGGGDSSGGLTSPNLVLPSMSYGLANLGTSSAVALPSQVGGVGGESAVAIPSSVGSASGVISHEMERKRSTVQSSLTKIVSAGGVTSSTTSTQAASEAESSVKVQSGDRSYESRNTASAMKSRLDVDGTVAEKTSGVKTNASRMAIGDRLMHEQSNVASMKGTKFQSGSLAFENTSEALSSHTSSVMGDTMVQDHRSFTSAQSKFSVTRSNSLMSANQLQELMNNMHMTHEEVKSGLKHFDDLEKLTPTTSVKNVENALVKYCGIMMGSVDAMKKDMDADSLADWMSKVNGMMTKAWEVPSFGYEIGNSLCDIMRNNGGLDLLLDKCASDNPKLQYQSAKLLQQCLVTENRGYVVEKGLDKVVLVAKDYTQDIKNVERSRVGVGILEHLFKHSETTCGDVIAMGGLGAVVEQCKSTDVGTLRHCAGALANVAMYGGAENQEAMIRRKVQSWLFPLAFHDDDTIKYYACLAIAALVANKELEAAVQKSGTLDLIEPFVQTHTPKAFAETSATHSHGQSPNWLKRLIPLLTSHREEARNLAAFHFCMEAEIKKQQNKTELFSEISAIESLKKVASSPNGIASKYAAQTLRLIGEEVPHKLSQQVPTWSVEDVKEWVKQIGFAQFSESFVESRVDGDLLLQLSEEMLREDIQMRNGILRRRFLRELGNLKRVADYSCCDSNGLNKFLQSLGPEYSIYTYDLINAGIDYDTLMTINDEQLLSECGIKNKIHRLRIQQGARVERGDISITDESGSIDKSLDVFISYRRSNGSQLASLLKVHLEIRNMSVFLDVDRLVSGKFDNNLLQSIRSAKNFVLVLTPGALDRCFGDHEMRDWIHKEVACAIQSDCKIIPVFDNFAMPDQSQLPDTMKAVTSFNAVNWVHDYQEACVDKIERWIRGDSSYMMDRFLNSQPSSSSAYSGATNTFNRQNTYMRTGSRDDSSCNSDGGGTATETTSASTPPARDHPQQQQ